MTRHFSRMRIPRSLRRQFAAVLLLAIVATAVTARDPALVPRPNLLQRGSGEFPLPDVLTIRVGRSGADAREIAQTLVQRVAQACGRRLQVLAGGARDGALELQQRVGPKDASPEAYRIEVNPRRMRIQAATPAGLRHGTTTMLQLLCARGATGVPALRIEDAPRFAWRGLMLDSARHYQSPDYLRRFIDAMALHKLNVLHWHLTDDQAWRLEIRKYPKLTEVGAWRVPAGAAAQADIDAATGKPRQYGGYYSQQEVRDLVAYAQQRGITIVPEIEMPGHASAAIAAYPELGAMPGAVTAVPADWGIYPNAFALDDATFGFIQDVLTETMALFPSTYIHVGGDEVESTQWKASAAGKALVATLGTDDGHALQAHFTERVARFLESKGRRLLGWDEILSPGLADGATVMSWRGIEGAIQAAKQGHDTVLSPWPTLYFDNRQSPAPDEPPGRVSVISLETVYRFEPMPADLDASARRHVLGLQGDIWTEHIRTEARVDHMTFPRAAAIAELGWTDTARRDWSDFSIRVPSLFPHYAALGIQAADSAYAVQAKIAANADDTRAQVQLLTQSGVGEIRYTLDDSAPQAGSPRYAAPLTLALPATLRANAFVDGVAVARERRYAWGRSSLAHRESRELQLCSENIALTLEDDAPVVGERAVFALDIQNPCWIVSGVDLSGPAKLEVGVGQVPFNFQIGAARDQIRFATPTTPEGELLVHLDRCDGKLVARLPLASAAASQGVTALAPASIPARGARHDLCLRFAQHRLDPMWAIDSVRWGPP
jgi:hexosaminidase